MTKASVSIPGSEESNGWQNIGIMYKYALSLNMKPVEFSIFMLIVNYSFGYKKTETEISIKQFVNELNISNSTAIRTIKKLLDSGSVERIKWQNMGPKQIYKYRLKFPPKQFGYISINTKNKKETKKELHLKKLEDDFEKAL